MMNTALASARPITGLASLWRSTIGKKYVMAISGLIWFGYLILHLWGNLKIYAGPSFLNDYASWLRTVGDPLFGYSQLLWLVRIILIPAFIVHVWSAVELTNRDRASRPSRYQLRKNLKSTFASRTMIYGGVFILLFVIFHLLDFTFGTANPSYQEGNVFHNVVASFQRWPVVLFYELAMIAVGLHLFHGIWSTAQTLGWNSARTTRGVRNVATVFAVLLTLGNMSIPLSVLTGIVR